jgi:methylmalonyl-CoA mutase N-terminal domain/subunit
LAEPTIVKPSVPQATMSGLPLEPVHVAAEHGAAPAPGEYPYTRGLHPQMYRSRLWTMRMFAGFGAPEDTNRRFRDLLAGGQTGLSTAFDMPALMGYDPDHALSVGEVGREGVSVASVDDMQRLFADVDLDAVSVSMTISGPAPVALALYTAAAEQRGFERTRLRGTLQTDILKEYIAQREWIVPERAGMRLVGDLIAFCADEMPLWHPVSISGYHIREAGSTAAQELAFTIADGVAYAEELVARGVDPDVFLPRFSFFFNCHIDFFEEIAKLRAARRMWARLMKDRIGARDERSWQLRTHCQTSGVSLTAQQPLVNIARTAIEALAGVLGGTQSLHTNSYDETYAIPTLEAATIALRTQQVLAYETGAASVADPLGGSHFVEQLTDRIEAEAQAYLDEIDRRGGMVAAVEQGYPQAEIADAAYRFQTAVERGERVVVGVTHFAADEEPEIDLHRADPAVERDQVARVRALRASRDATAHAAAIADVRAACAGDANVMPALVAAAHAGATIGELCDVFREVFGVYRDPGRY